MNVKITKLKPYKKRIKNNASPHLSSCPYCLSPLVLDNLGLQQCSGKALATWEADFVVYSKLTDPQKILFLKTISDIDKFEDLYMRWNYLDENGLRSNFQCGYTNNVAFNIVKYKTVIPDPIFVQKIETSLNRKLTELELRGEEELYRRGGKYFKDYKKGRTRVIIPAVEFPNDF